MFNQNKFQLESKGIDVKKAVFVASKPLPTPCRPKHRPQLLGAASLVLHTPVADLCAVPSPPGDEACTSITILKFFVLPVTHHDDITTQV